MAELRLDEASTGGTPPERSGPVSAAAEGSGQRPEPSAMSAVASRPAAPPRARSTSRVQARRRRRGDRDRPSKLRGVKLLWNERGFELVGAFCIAGLALCGTWVLIQGIIGLSTVAAGLLATGAAAWTLEMISRRHYADRLRPADPLPRATSVGARGGTGSASTEASRRSGSAASGPRRTPRPARPAARERPAADQSAERLNAGSDARRRGAATVAGRRAAARRAA